jgi:hypothetical protein
LKRARRNNAKWLFLEVVQLSRDSFVLLREEMKGEVKVATGVCLCQDRKSRPYRIKKTIDKKEKAFYFATLEEAVEEREAYQQAKVDTVSVKRQALAPKRAADVAKHGSNAALERRVSYAIVGAWKKRTGRDAMVLNDGTAGDILLQRKDDRYLVVQVKTTQKKVKGKNGYRFRHVLGYTNMLVFCFCESDAIGWLIGGTNLDERGIEDLYITPDAPLKQLVLANGSIDDLVKYLDEHIDEWPSTTEVEARGMPSSPRTKQRK